MEFHRTDAPRAHENEFFELYYLESYPIPILPLRPPNPYTITHAGLAIRSTISEKIIVLEYLPINEQIAYLPLISSTLNGSVTTIQWNQNAVITQAKFINESYWKRSIYLTRINNVVYHKYLDWVDDYIFSHSLFIPYTVCLHATAQTRDNKKRTSSFKGSRRMSSKSESDGYPPPSTLTCPFQKQTWDTFIIDSFNKLSEFAVTINPITPLYHMNWIYYSKYVPDRVLLEDDPSVIPYFTQLVSCMKDQSLNTSDFISATNTCSRISHTKTITREQHLLHYEDNVYLLLTPPASPSHSSSTSSIGFNTLYASSSYEAIPLPPPPELHLEKGSYTDFVILIGIGVFMAIGMVLALWKVGCIRRVSESSRRRYSQRHHHERVKLMSEDENEVDIETREVELYSLGH